MQTYKTIDEYIANFSADIQEILQKIRKIAKEEIPNGEETISYGVPTIKNNGKYVVYFAGYKSHISIYPVFANMEEDLPAAVEYRKGKGTLKFSLSKPLPYSLIRQIIAKLLIENLKRTKKY